MTEPLEVSVEVPASRDRVWAAWTTAPGLVSWLCARARVEPEVGGAFELFWDADETVPDRNSTLGCTVLSLDAPRLLRFTWRGPVELHDVMNVPGAPRTEVEVRMLPTLDGTRVELTHSGWGEGPAWGEAREWFAQAWEGAFRRLREALASEPAPA